jgi:hypothetical protein
VCRRVEGVDGKGRFKILEREREVLGCETPQVELPRSDGVEYPWIKDWAFGKAGFSGTRQYCPYFVGDPSGDVSV